jgi:hypothetical protein
MDMDILGLCFVVQLCLAFGVAGLFWPEKIMPLFDVLMFPWAATYRSVRANSIAALGLSALLLARLLAVMR